MADFTPQQANRWIEQEFAKVNVNDPAHLQQRIRSEQRMVKFIDAQPKPSPGSRAAHAGLLARLTAEVK